MGIVRPYIHEMASFTKGQLNPLQFPLIDFLILQFKDVLAGQNINCRHTIDSNHKYSLEAVISCTAVITSLTYYGLDPS